MFQSISSFLPSPFQQLSADKSSPSPQAIPSPNQPEPPKDMRTIEENATKKKKEKTNESFIVVRPPPSKTNHPLNLQVQLVPPSNKDRPSTRQSLDSTAENEFGSSHVSLSRTSSNRSETSMYSSYSSTGSLSTIGSSSTTSSGRRMIIPLYNLQAHNVMQNVIADAGTDAKVAKFLKRGLEVIGLAVFEPVEVWGAGAVDDQGRRTSVDYGHGLSPESLHTPTSSAVSLNTSENTQDNTATPVPPAPPPITPSPSSGRPGSRKIFGKLFRKKDAGSTTPVESPQPMPVASAVPSVESTRLKRSSLLSAHGYPSVPSSPEPPLQPPVLGIQPSLRSPTVPPRGRPTKYVWVVRKWLKGEPDSVFSGVKDKFHEVRSSIAPTPLEGLVEVRFEWSRGRAPKRRGRDGERTSEPSARRDTSRRENRDSLTASSATPSTALLQHQVVHSPTRSAQHQKTRTLSPSGGGGRRSMDSTRSVSPGPSIVTGESFESARAQRRPRDGEEDDGSDSDPEDSETPWTCTLVVRRLHAALPSRMSHPGSPLAPQSPPQAVRVKVAAVVPTPHHPKVVALLKVPFPLPDVEIERVALRKRVVTPAGVARPAIEPEADASPSGSAKSGKFWNPSGKENGGQEQAPSLILTAEEIKDVVSCTGLWLVVREGFGGVGRERRKGDRWMLRG